MKERSILAAFGKALVETPLSIVLLVLDIAGIGAVLYWVIDDVREAGVIVAFLVILFTSQYFVFRKLWTSYQSVPKIVFDQVRQAQIYQKSQILDKKVATYQLVQIWFRNIPLFQSESSVAREVTAKVTVAQKDDAPILEYFGQWAQSNAPDNVGYDDYLDKIDITPGHLRAKLMIVLKYSSDSDCYAFTREGFRSDPDGRSRRYAISEGVYEFTICLSGIGVNDTYKFLLTNHGSGREIELSKFIGR